MSSNLKFRAYDKKAKKWLLGYEYPNLGGFSLFGECMLMGEWAGILNEYILNYETYGHDESDLVVMQFTGLKDVNNNEIYVDDIVTFTRNIGNYQTGNSHPYTTTHQIVFDKLHCRFGLKYHSDTQLLRKFTGYKYEIIGNIYQNSDLLK